MKVILSRMGENVKCACIGDVEQIDSPYLNQSNNGLNWIVRAFMGQNNYGHMVLRGKHSRGPIADMVRNSIL
jgi:PhoH-like ATPase